MLRTLALALATTLLSACVATNSSPVCPPLYAYSDEQQDQAAAELEAIPHGVVRDVLIPDYGRVREAIRACRGEKT